MGTVPISVIYGYSYPIEKSAAATAAEPVAGSGPRRGAELLPVSRAAVWPSSLAKQQTARTEVDGKILHDNTFSAAAASGVSDVEDGQVRGAERCSAAQCGGQQQQ